MEMRLPKDVEIIINQLLQNGYDAYAVGGCVRDTMLGNEPDDWDITTSAKPFQTKKIFKRTVDTGIKHGTVTVLLGKNSYEVTTYRIDGEYQDNRHPKEVTFTTDLIEDLQRRDFTMNAMAYNSHHGLVDAFGGMEDLQNKIIRCVGDPMERFTEDALRMLRAVRFSAQLGFSIDEGTREAIKELAPNLTHISAERIQTELLKLLGSPNPDKLKIAYELGITKIILPEFDVMMGAPYKQTDSRGTVGKHALHTLTYAEADKSIRLAMLLMDVGKAYVNTAETGGDYLPKHRKQEDNTVIGGTVCHDKQKEAGADWYHVQDKAGTDCYDKQNEAGAKMAGGICKRLKLDNHTLDKVIKIVRWHDYEIELSERGIRRGIHRIGEDIFPYLFTVKRADVNAGNAPDKEEKLRQINTAEAIYHDVVKKGQCVSLKTLQITGRDLIELGIKPGKEMGSLLNQLLAMVIDDSSLNHRDTLLHIVKNLLENNGMVYNEVVNNEIKNKQSVIE